MKRIALAQMTSTLHQEENQQKAFAFIEEAADHGAGLIAFPENFLLLGNKGLYLQSAQTIPGPLVEQFQKKAADRNISILMGSIYEQIPDNPEKLYTTSVLIDKSGEISGTYRKIHLFDVALKKVRLMESDLVIAGNEPVICSNEIATIGLTICYDVRFPNLFQILCERGADVIFVPAAFTVPTGEAHWLHLLRARAIENQVYIAAPAQVGKHSAKRESYGHTVFIDPWGEIQEVLPSGEGLIYGELDLEYLKEIRRQMSVYHHRVKGIDTHTTLTSRQ